ncbi:hypothetical protein ABTM72_20365, partial [Acinetobacter baumannii]
IDDDRCCFTINTACSAAFVIATDRVGGTAAGICGAIGVDTSGVGTGRAGRQIRIIDWFIIAGTGIGKYLVSFPQR